MNTYAIIYQHGAKKELKRLDRRVQRIIRQAIDSLAIEPKPSRSKQLEDSPYRSLRVDRYRVIYAIENEEITVYVLRIRHRKDAYKRF